MAVVIILGGGIMNKRSSSSSGVTDIKMQKIGYMSSDGKTQIQAQLWTSSQTGIHPKGIVQIVHGMAEHILRYDDFARFLVRHGYVVCGHDMIGHGNSVDSSQDLSCIPMNGGKDYLLEDIDELRKLVAARFARQTPYFILGHSMGSFLVRVYSTRYGEGLSGVILSGTGHQSSFITSAGKTCARCIARFKGENYRSSFLDSLAVGAYSKAIANPRTSHDWLSRDEEIVDAYRSDPLCGVMFSAGAYATLIDIISDASAAKEANGIPKELPLLFLSGDEDPVGDKGSGVMKSVDAFKRAGLTEVSSKLYPGMRHEILNETGKEEVYTDIIQWIEEVVTSNKDKE